MGKERARYPLGGIAGHKFREHLQQEAAERKKARQARRRQSKVFGQGNVGRTEKAAKIWFWAMKSMGKRPLGQQRKARDRRRAIVLKLAVDEVVAKALPRGRMLRGGNTLILRGEQRHLLGERERDALEGELGSKHNLSAKNISDEVKALAATLREALGKHLES